MAHLLELMNGAMLVEAVLLSFLLALWLTWMAMRGVFCLMPVTVRPATVRGARQAQPMVSGRDARAPRGRIGIGATNDFESQQEPQREERSKPC